MKDIAKMAAIIIITMGVNTFILSKQIDNVRQEIVELKKDFSYDPKDAK